MKAFVLATLLFLLNDFVSNGQENFLEWDETVPLKWDDFLGEASDTSNFDAEVFAEVKYTYKFNSLNEYYFDTKACFNRTTSWRKKEHCSEALLKHEQAHFDMAQLYACKLKRTFENYHYSLNFRQEISQIFEDIKTEYHKMQRLFDEETNHSLIEEKQKEWEKLVKEELQRFQCNPESMAEVVL